MAKQAKTGVSKTYPVEYIIQICKYQWYKEIKRQQIYDNNKHEMEIPSDLQDQGEESEKIRLLLKHLNTMSPICKKILTLYAHGYSELKIAKTLNLANKIAVKNKKKYCREELRKIMTNDPLFNNIYGRPV
jgi:DNA-directed RNA polymerase specialized sigma24 family protein